MTNKTVDEAITKKSVDGLVCVSLDVHLWSGRKRLKKEALIAKNPEFANLPPETLATLGSIKICDTDDLAPFLSLKREAEKLLAYNGLPLLGTIGIPQGKLDDVYKSLVRIKAEFDQTATSFKRRFETAIELWRDHPDNKEWAGLISDIPTPEHVAGRLSFGFYLCRVSAPSSEEFSDANAMYAEQMTGLKGELFADAAKEAEILITKYLTGDNGSGAITKREKVTWKTLRPLKRIGEKFQNFSFLDPTCEPLARMIDHVLKLLPNDGPIDGVNLMHVWTISQTLANPGKAMRIARLAFESESPADAFEQLLTFGGAPAATFESPAAIAVETSNPGTGVDAGFLDQPHSAPVQPAFHGNQLERTGAEAEQPMFIGLF